MDNNNQYMNADNTNVDTLVKEVMMARE